MKSRRAFHGLRSETLRSPKSSFSKKLSCSRALERSALADPALKRQPFPPLHCCPRPPHTLRSLFGTRPIGAKHEKADLVNFRCPDCRKLSELCVLLFFLGKIDTKIFPKSRFSKRIFGDSAASTKLDRPHCKQSRAGVGDGGPGGGWSGRSLQAALGARPESGSSRHVPWPTKSLRKLVVGESFRCLSSWWAPKKIFPPPFPSPQILPRRPSPSRASSPSFIFY